MAQDNITVSEFANYDKYAAQNRQIINHRQWPQVVFMGNSITEYWVSMRPDFFSSNNFLGRGISGQVTHQMLLRFQQDVVELKPKQVVILAGTNDIAQNAGLVTLEDIMASIKSMAEIALQHDIKVILCSVPPAIRFPWMPSVDPVPQILSLNEMIKGYANAISVPYADYFEVLKDDQNGMSVPKYTSAEDLVHPNEAAYRRMEAVILPLIQRQLEED